MSVTPPPAPIEPDDVHKRVCAVIGNIEAKWNAEREGARRTGMPIHPTTLTAIRRACLYGGIQLALTDGVALGRAKAIDDLRSGP